VTVTAEISENGAVTLHHMNFSVYVGRDNISASEMTCIVSGGALNSTHSLTHVTIFSWMFATACCLVVWLGLGLMSGWLVVFILLSVAIATLP